MRSYSWSVATLTTGRCHWTGTTSSCLALPVCVCVNVYTWVCVCIMNRGQGAADMNGTQDGVLFSISSKCSHWCQYNHDRHNPSCFISLLPPPLCTPALVLLLLLCVFNTCPAIFFSTPFTLLFPYISILALVFSLSHASLRSLVHVE